jgi:hypothetical protein
MSCGQNVEQRLSKLQDEISRTRTVTSELMFEVITHGCLRFHAQHPSHKAKVARLIESGAFNDAILALQELELPQWKLRRVAYDDGEWHCSFSRQLGVPAELDEMAEATHEILSVAMLCAFLEARHLSQTENGARRGTVPLVQPMQNHVICCDNFA